MRRVIATFGVLATAAFAAAGCGGDSGGGPATIRFYGGPENSGALDKAVADCSKQSGGKYNISFEKLPADADGQREQLVRRLAAEDDGIDLINMDVIWTAEFAEAGWIQPWEGANEKAAIDGVLEGPLRTVRYGGKVYGAPFNTNTQLLWYRGDLVKSPPKTWEEMISQAKEIGGKAGHVLVQGKQYEGLTVWFNSLVASAGGSILKEGGDEASLGEPALKALETMKQVATQVGDPSLSNQAEDETRLAFQEGNAAFMVNYSFVYPSAKEEAPKIYKNMKWAPWPTLKEGEPAHVTIGGYNIGVSKFTKHKDEAFAAAKCLLKRKNQKDIALKAGLPPVLADLYDDPEIKKANPFIDDVKTSLREASVRPPTPAYNDVSLAIQKSLSPPRSIDPKATLEELSGKIDDALNSRGLL
ncbi:MAG: ABC transporter substrate-binding protein [Solirubrobacterales bacterium]|nr:ABC transporter substrate-binding protein [Solirubrobacterales bacterium]